jgi:hypothetical protein
LLSTFGSNYKCLDWAGDVLKADCTELIELQAKTAMHVVTHRARDANLPGGTYRLEPYGYVYRFAVQVCSVWDGIAYIDPSSEANGALRRLIGVKDWNLLLHLDGTAYGPIDAIEHDK